MGEKSQYFIGIDLGTSYSAIAWVKYGGKRDFEPENIEIFQKGRGEKRFLLPSVVDFGPQHPEVGRRISKAECVVDGFWIKKHIGADEVYPLSSPGCAKAKVTPREAAVEILRFFYHKIKDSLKVDWGQDKITVTLAIPAFDPKKHSDPSIVFTECAQEAGFPTIEIVQEPVAALLDIHYKKEQEALSTEDNIILVVDYGGGTCDITVIRTGYRTLFHTGATGEILSVVSSGCGGRRIDIKIAEKLREKFDKYKTMDEFELREYARKLKERLSIEQVDEEDLSYNEFIQTSEVVIKDLPKLIDEALKKAKETLERQRQKKTQIQIDRVILTGGGSRHPLVKKKIREHLAQRQGKVPEFIEAPYPQLSVSRGAALYGFYRAVHQLPYLRRSAYEVILKFPDGKSKVLIKEGAEIPSKKPKSYVFKTPKDTEIIILELLRRSRKGRNESLITGEFRLRKQLSTNQRIIVEVELDLFGNARFAIREYGTKKLLSEKIIMISL